MANQFDDIPAADQEATSRSNAFDDLTPPNAFESARHGRVTAGNPYALPLNSPVRDEGEGQMTLEAIGRGMSNVGRHLGNLISMTDLGNTPQERFLTGLGAPGYEGRTHPLVSDQDIADARVLDQPLLSQPAGRFGSGFGEAAAITPLMMTGGAGLTAAGAGPLLSGVALGAGQGALLGDPGERGSGALTGAVTGAMLPLAGQGLHSAVHGITRTPEAQQLIDQGVRLTPGQMNPAGVWNKIEENIRSLPVIGNIIERARTRSQQDFQRGVIQEASAPGHVLQTAGHDPNELFQEAQDSYRPLYQAASGFRVQPLLPARNQTLAYALQQAANNKTVGAGAEIRQNAQDFLEGQMQANNERAVAAGGWKSDDLIKLRSGINEEIRNAGVDQSGKKYAQLLRGARDAVTESIDSQIPPEASAALKTANDAYPKLAIIRDAIKRGGDQEQGFTPAQLSQAVRSASEDNQYARGGGLMRDWSSAGRDIFTERNPRTGASHGTTGALGAAAYGIHHFLPGAQIPAALGSLGALGMIGTQTGREILGGSTAAQQAAQRLAAGLRNIISPGQRQIASAVTQSAINRSLASQAHPAQ